MDVKQEILDTPRALKETLEKGKPEYEALVRRTRWGEGPIYMVGSGSSFLVALTGVYAFEGLLGWPVIPRSAAAFGLYASSVLRPRSIVLAISKSGETSETLEAARAARARGAVLLALTSNPTGLLAAMADGVVLFRAGEEHQLGMKADVCQQAALSYLGLVAAQTLKRHHHQLDLLEEEFEKLPGHVEWALTQIPDAVRSFVSELKGLQRLSVVGGGFYHPVALQWARRLEELAEIHAEGFEAEEVHPAALAILKRHAAFVFLSGSRCGVKKKTYQLLDSVKGAGAKILSVTDREDRELAEASRLAVLLPVLSEMVGSILTLALLEWVAFHTAREQGRDPHRFGFAKDRGEEE